MPTVLIFYYPSPQPPLPTTTLPPFITTLIQSPNGYPPSTHLPPVIMISPIRPMPSPSPMAMLLTISHSTTPPITMMIVLHHLQFRQTTHLTTPFPLPAPTSNIPLLPLPWTSARYIPKMPMDFGVEHVTEMVISSITVNATRPNLNTSFIGCALTTLMLGSYKKHG